MVSLETPYDGSSHSDVGSLKEKSRTHDKLDNAGDEFDVYGDESHADSAFDCFCDDSPANKDFSQSQIPYHGLEESCCPDACGDSFPWSTWPDSRM